MKVNLYLLVILFALGCGEKSTVLPQCGDQGKNVTLDGETYCVYRQNVVVENGFKCPPELPMLRQDSGIGVCSKGDKGSLDDLRDKFRDLDPDYEGCTKKRHCAENFTCNSGTCEKGNGPVACGGNSMNSIPCSSDEYCLFTEEKNCGEGDLPGVCTKKPASGLECSAIFEPVCGCDKKTYANSCELSKAAVSIASQGECAECTSNAECLDDKQCIQGQCIVPATCGGIQGLACGANEYCFYKKEDKCGAADQTGKCYITPLLASCAGGAEFPVCGCDGKDYDKPCLAYVAGTAVASDGKCP